MSDTKSTPEVQGKKKERHRSPAYPSISLKAALDHATTIYKHEKRSASPVSVVAEHLGTDIKSSKGLRLVAALKQYGLVVETGSGEDRQFKLSERALDILLPHGSEQDREKAISDAALAPPIHKKIWEHYEGVLPSDSTLKAHVCRTLDFNDKHVNRFIKTFLATLAFAKLTQQDTIDDSPDDDEDDDESSESSSLSSSSSMSSSLLLAPKPQPQQRQQVTAFGKPAETTMRIPITLPSLKVAWLEVPQPLSELEFTTLTNSLTMFKDALTKRPEPSPQVRERVVSLDNDERE